MIISLKIIKSIIGTHTFKKRINIKFYKLNYELIVAMYNISIFINVKLTIIYISNISC